MADGLHFSLHGGTWATGEALRARVGPALEPRVKRAGLLVQAGIQRRCLSFRRTGNLMRSWTTGTPEWQGPVLAVKVGTPVVYAHYQDTATVNKGYIKAGIADAKPEALRELQTGLAEALRGSWVKE